MRSILKLNLVCCIIFACLIYSCKKKDTTKNEDDAAKGASFDRKTMLTNMANNIIIPNYQNFQRITISLDSAITAFNLNPDSIKLQALQALFKDTYRVWQSCSTFGFGPADQEYLNVNTNTFPTDTAHINAYITSGTYDLNALANLDVKGLPALDYLLFGIGANNTSILAKYTTAGDAAHRKQYLADLSADMKTKITTVVNDWLPASGNYLTTFVNATGTDVGSSVGQLTNQMDYNLDLVKNYKLGIPLGKQSMGTPYPGKVEAYYCGISSELILLQVKAIQSIYLGKSSQGDGSGFDDYLIYINAQYNNGSLNDAITSQFSTTISKLQAVPDPLSADISGNSAAANAAYTEVQKLLVLLKTDMTSAMGVLVTYEDNDGD